MQKYPTILGADAAGYIEEVGEGVTHLQKGQRVIGYVHNIVLDGSMITKHQVGIAPVLVFKTMNLEPFSSTAKPPRTSFPRSLMT